MTDPQGNELFHITNKLVSFRKTILGTDKAEDRQLFKVVKKISCTFVGSFVLVWQSGALFVLAWVS